eukprot:10091208-Ditylum_brightwellii.AAC.1
MQQVAKSDNNDWNKLEQVLCFLNDTIDDVRKIRATSLTEMFTWIDALYAVYDNMRSHMGGLISLGLGIVHRKSAMEKINTKSLTDAELVGMAEYLPYNI